MGNNVTIEAFVMRLEELLGVPSQPSLIPFLCKNLDALKLALTNGQIDIQGLVQLSEIDSPESPRVTSTMERLLSDLQQPTTSSFMNVNSGIIFVISF